MKQAMQWMVAALLAAGMTVPSIGCASQRALREERAARVEAERRAEDEAAQNAALRGKVRETAQEAREAAADAERERKAHMEEAAKRKAAESRIRDLEALPKASAAETPVVAEAVAGCADETAAVLRVRLEIGPAAEAGTLENALRSRVEGALADAGFRVVETGPFEVETTVSLRARQVNARGSRVAWEGDADAAVRQLTDNSRGQETAIFEPAARSWTDVASGEARSADAAQKKLAERLAEELVPFVAGAVNRIGERLRLSELVVADAWAPKDATGYPTRFTSAVLAMPGVYRCEVKEFDRKGKTLRAEVVYDTVCYPDGFANRLQLDGELGFGHKE